MPRLGELAVLMLLCGVQACAQPVAPAVTLPSPRVTLLPPPDAALDLARRIPAQAARCVVSRPERIRPEERGLMMLVSRTELLPWGVELPIEAFVRARVRTQEGSQTRMWIRFAEGAGGPERIRAALRSASGSSLRWESDGARCSNPIDCQGTLARFFGERDVELARGGFAALPGDSTNRCASLAAEFPDALEVASWAHEPSFADDGAARQTEWVLLRRRDGLRKLRRRIFESAAQRNLAQRDAALGVEDVPRIAGLPVDVYRTAQGEVLAEQADILWDDLRLVIQDQARLRIARRGGKAPGASGLDPIGRIREQAQLLYLGLSRKSGKERVAEARTLSAWLLRMRRSHSRDAALASIQYRLFLRELGDARSALSIADEVLHKSMGDVREWSLLRRRALAALGHRDLGPALADAHGLGRKSAARMASEIIGSVAAGADYERVEWAWLTARDLTQRGDRLHTTRVDGLSLPLASIPRALAYLAGRGEGVRGNYGVHVLARGQLSDGPPPRDGGAWAAISRGGGRAALVGAASSVDDEQLRELGALLRAKLQPGAAWLLVSVEGLGNGEPRAMRATLLLSGQVEGDTLNVETADLRSAHIDWPRVRRYLVEPLRSLTGRAFPPEELRMRAQDEGMAQEMVTRGEVDGVRCQRVELWVSCRGPLHDASAPLRALLRMDDWILASESQKLWGRPGR